MKKKQFITKDMLIADIVGTYPDLSPVLEEEYGFHCVSCFASAMETLEQGAGGHGMTDEDITVMIENLNELIAAEQKA